MLGIEKAHTLRKDKKMLPDKALKIYKVSEKKADEVVSGQVNGKDWVWSGGFKLEGLGMYWLQEGTAMPKQPSGVTPTAVTDLGEVAMLATNIGIEHYPLALSDEKIAAFKTWGYDLINKYTDKQGIQEAAETWLNSQ